MKTCFKGTILLLLLVLDQTQATVLHGRNSGHKKIKKRKTLQTDYYDRLGELEELGSTQPGEKLDRFVLLSLISLLSVNMLGKGFLSPDGRKIKRNRAKKSKRRLSNEKPKDHTVDLFDTFMSGGDIQPLLNEKKEKIVTYLKEKGVKLSQQTKFKDVWPLCKRFCKTNMGLDEETFGMVKPMIKKFFTTLTSDKDFMASHGSKDKKLK